MNLQRQALINSKPQNVHEIIICPDSPDGLPIVIGCEFQAERCLKNPAEGKAGRKRTKNEAPRDVSGEFIFIGREGIRFQAECFLNAPHLFCCILLPRNPKSIRESLKCR